MTDSRMGRRLPGAALIGAALLLVPAQHAAAQVEGADRPTIRDIVIGAPVEAQPDNFQEFACGTNGGPPSVPVSGFADFARCEAEETGLHEVQFRYDDEPHFRALARRDLLRAEFLYGTRIGNFEILASALIDDAGIVRGVRAVTDDRVPVNKRRYNYSMTQFLRSVYGSEGWECVEHPPEEGETPVGNSLVKQDCRKLTDDGLVLLTRSRLLRRPGQTLIDPITRQPVAGQYESKAWLEIYAADANGNPIYSGEAGAPAAPAEVAAAPAPEGPEGAFLAGLSKDCPGCDLSGADLRRRELTGADLTGANLAGATLHRARLGGAKLDGANLAGANLNLADLKRASLAGADLTDAFLYQADAAAADFTNADLDGTMAEKARFTNATMAGVSWLGGSAFGANLAGADLTGAHLAGATFAEGDLQRATLAGADLTDVSFYRSRLRGADLSEVTALRADFLEADLSEVSFAHAQLNDARLLRARAAGIDLTGADRSGAVMPDGNVVQ